MKGAIKNFSMWMGAMQMMQEAECHLFAFQHWHPPPAFLLKTQRVASLYFLFWKKKTTLNGLVLEFLIPLLCWWARQEHSTPERAWGGGSCGMNEATLTSRQAHSPTQSLLTENTRVNQKGQVCFGFLQFTSIITVLRVGSWRGRAK